MTALFRVLQEGLASFGQPREGDSFYVISDGDDNLSQIKWRKVDQEILRARIRVFAMLVQWIGPPIVEGDDHLMDLVRSPADMPVCYRWIPTSTMILFTTAL
jgi:hypothetical protein